MSQALSQGNAAAKAGRNFLSMVRKYMPQRLAMALKNLAMRSKRFRPLPEFDRADNPSWVLLRRMLHDWIRASPTPALVIPIPHHFFLSSPRDARYYQARFRELADAAGCELYDPLPDFLQLPAEQRAALWSDASGHISIRGHEILASLLAPVVQKLMAAGGVRPAGR
jgi:lysophospholipase L1-like esterase